MNYFRRTFRLPSYRNFPQKEEISYQKLSDGFAVKIGSKKYKIRYPTSVWKIFPSRQKHFLMKSFTYLSTLHLIFIKPKNLLYNFSPPLLEPYFFQGMFYTLGETALGEKELSTPKLLRYFYNRTYRIGFKDSRRSLIPSKTKRPVLNRVFLPFTFGKDSLLTFALCQELGIDPLPCYFEEPKTPAENRHKRELSHKFSQATGKKIIFFPIKMGSIKHVIGYWWGWDLLLTQYTLLALPFTNYYRCRYLFWSNEASCNNELIDKNGFIVNPVFEQSNRWTIRMNNLVGISGLSTEVNSLVEPIHELGVIRILHHRYPGLAKFQTSCWGDNKSAKQNRWCQSCSKCARMFIFFLALGVDPKRVGMKENLLAREKSSYYSLFAGKSHRVSGYDESFLGRDEQLLAFLLAYKRGIKGDLMRLFSQRFLKLAKKREKYLREKYFGIHSFESVPQSLQPRLIKIFKEELDPLRK